MSATARDQLKFAFEGLAASHNSPIKSIADVLGHRSIDTTFIYAKDSKKQRKSRLNRKDRCACIGVTRSIEKIYGELQPER